MGRIPILVNHSERAVAVGKARDQEAVGPQGDKDITAKGQQRSVFDMLEHVERGDGVQRGGRQIARTIDYADASLLGLCPKGGLDFGPVDLIVLR